MAESIGPRTNAIPDATTAKELRALLNAAQTDIAALRAAFLSLTAKLDADTVSGLDDDYASVCNPAALTFTK